MLFLYFFVILPFLDEMPQILAFNKEITNETHWQVKLILFYFYYLYLLSIFNDCYTEGMLKKYSPNKNWEYTQKIEKTLKNDTVEWNCHLLSKFEFKK